MATNRMRVLGGAIEVGDYVTTTKPTDVWWKVESIRTEPCASGFLRYFTVINKGGYRKEISDNAHRRLYKWITD